MNRLNRPERLLVAAMLVAVLVVDAVVFNEVRVPVVALGGLLFVVFVVGAFDPMAESVYLQISLSIICVLITGYALFRGLLVLGGIAALSALNAGWIAYRDQWTAGQHGSR